MILGRVEANPILFLLAGLDDVATNSDLDNFARSFQRREDIVRYDFEMA